MSDKTINPHADRDAYVDKLASWMEADSARIGRCVTLDGIYAGKSRRIYEMVRLAYRRGIRRGLALAWEAKQPITIRSQEALT